MFAYIKGSLEEISTNFVVIDVNGIGYKIFVTEPVIQNIGNIGDIVKLHTYYHVMQDNSVCLYGFLTKEELRMFELLISVSGIGAKSAIVTLSNIDPSNFALAVITDNVTLLNKIPGVGKKTAQRIILELKDKIKTEEAVAKTPEIEVSVDNNENCQDAIQALQILGYNRKDIEKAFEKIANKDVSVEELIKKGLTLLSR